MSGKVWLWEGDGGRVEARLIGPLFLLTTLHGRVDNYAVPEMEACMREVAHLEGMNFFWDAYELTGVSNGFRGAMTDALLANRKTLGSVVTLSNSALIAMAVSTANLVLGGIVKSYRKPEDFMAAKRELAISHGLDLDLLAG